MNDVIEEAKQLAAKEDKFKAALGKVYGLEEKQNADYQAVTQLAIECGAKLFNILRSARTRTGVLQGYMDLTIGLNSNPFWDKRGTVLLPLLHSALQAQSDYALLMMEKQTAPNLTYNDALIAQTQLAGIEIFVLIAYCIGGQSFMNLKSLEIKKTLAPYFME